jgi:hypothetical protein
MALINTALPAVVVAGGLAAGILGVGSAPASAEPAPPPAPVQGGTGSLSCGTRVGADAGACG